MHLKRDEDKWSWNRGAYFSNRWAHDCLSLGTARPCCFFFVVCVLQIRRKYTPLLYLCVSNNTTMTSKKAFFEDAIHKSSPEYQAPKPPDEYTPVHIPSGKRDDGSVDAGSMKSRFVNTIQIRLCSNLVFRQPTRFRLSSTSIQQNMLLTFLCTRS